MVSLFLLLLYWKKAATENMFVINWELLKYEIAKFLRKYFSNLAKIRKLEEHDVINRISFLASKSADTQQVWEAAQVKRNIQK